MKLKLNYNTKIKRKKLDNNYEKRRGGGFLESILSLGGRALGVRGNILPQYIQRTFYMTLAY